MKTEEHGGAYFSPRWWTPDDLAVYDTERAFPTREGQIIAKDLYAGLGTIALAAAAALMGVTDTASAQNASNSDTDQNKFVLTKLSAPVYPSLAHATRISGNVQWMVKVRQDGTLDSLLKLSFAGPRPLPPSKTSV
jgi:hypothetical protein